MKSNLTHLTMAVLTLAFLMPSLIPTTASAAPDFARTGPLPTGNGPAMPGDKSVSVIMNSDNTYEDGYAWQNAGTVPPDDGSFAECYTFSQDTKITSIVMDLTQIGDQSGQTLDAYCWENDSFTNTPGIVLFMALGVDPGPIQAWPNFTRCYARPSECCSPCIQAGERVWVGYWGNWPGAPAGWYVGADLNGPGSGCPYAKITPGIGFPSGWQNVAVVWGATRDLGIGVEVLQEGPNCCETPDCAQSTFLPAGAVAWWDPVGPVGTDLPAATDLISPPSNGMAFTLPGDVTEVQGRVGRGFRFKGYNSYIEVPDAPKLNFGTNAFTIETWACWDPEANFSHQHRIIEKCGGGAVRPNVGWAVMIQPMAGGGLHLHIGNDLVWATIMPPKRKWFHLAITRVGTQIDFYVRTLDGTLTHTTKYANSVFNVSTSEPLCIGGTPVQPYGYFAGTIDEPTLYNRALNGDEIEQIFNAGCNGKHRPAPVAVLSIPSPLCAGGPMVADGSASLYATSYSWCWTRVLDDCQTPTPPYGQCYAACACPTWDFNQLPGNLPPGRYLIELYVSNDCGSDYASQCVEIQATGAPPVAVLSVPAVVCLGDPILADGTATQNATSYSWCWWPVLPDCETPVPPYGACYAPCACPTWDFDQAPGNLPAGHYIIQLWASNSCGTDHVEQCIEITTQPTTAQFVIPSPVCYGDPIVANAAGSNGTSFAWCWTRVAADCQTHVPPNDGQCFAPCSCPTWDFGANPGPGLMTPGHYLIELYVNGPCGSAYVSHCIEVLPEPCISSAEEGGAEAQLLLRQNSPNPFRDQTEIRFQLPGPRVIDLEIYDVGGRVLRRITSGFMNGGEHAAIWDGRTESGERVPPGLYFYRLRTGGRELSHKMLIVE